MNYSWKITIATAALTVVGGYVAGSAIAATAGDNSDRAPQVSVLEGDFPETAPLPEIGNGKTVGTLEGTMPISQRPDFLPVALDDGTPGYVKRTDIDDEMVWPVMKPGVTYKLDPEPLKAAELRRRTLLVQPNEKGEIWVDVYADDAKTVIGKKMMDDVSDPPPSDD